jgi:hypothetical protein
MMKKKTYFFTCRPNPAYMSVTVTKKSMPEFKFRHAENRDEQLIYKIIFKKKVAVL